MIEVLPAILPDDFEQLRDELAVVRGLVKTVQIDVTDGKFTPEATWPYNGEDDFEWQEIISEEQGMPYWQDFDFEIDMMVLEPEKKINDWIRAGISRSIFHLESSQKIDEAINLAREAGISPGLALKPSTPISDLEPFIEKIDFVQFMGNDKIGFHGVDLDKEKVISKIADLRAKYPNLIIAVDIGVNEDTAEDLVRAGANKLASGSAILRSGNPKTVIRYFQSLK